MDGAAAAGKIIAALKRKGNRGFKWKVGSAKAYDSFHQDLMWSSMKLRGFPNEWIKWVRRYIVTHMFFV